MWMVLSIEGLSFLAILVLGFMGGTHGALGIMVFVIFCCPLAVIVS